MKILKFYSKTCGPCKVLEKNLKAANIEYEDIDVATADEELLDRYDINAVPTLVVVGENNEVLMKHVGLINVDFLKECM